MKIHVDKFYPGEILDDRNDKYLELMREISLVLNGRADRFNIVEVVFDELIVEDLTSTGFSFKVNVVVHRFFGTVEINRHHEQVSIEVIFKQRWWQF
jgi:hypothetical protein